MSSKILLFVNKKKQKNFLRSRAESRGFSFSQWMKFFFASFLFTKKKTSPPP